VYVTCVCKCRLGFVPVGEVELVPLPAGCWTSSGVGGSSLLRLRTDDITAESELALKRSRGTGCASALGASGGNRPNVAPFGAAHLQTTQNISDTFVQHNTSSQFEILNNGAPRIQPVFMHAFDRCNYRTLYKTHLICFNNALC